MYKVSLSRTFFSRQVIVALCVCMCVCVCVFACVLMSACMNVCVRLRICMQVLCGMYTYKYICVHVYVCKCKINACTFIEEYAYHICACQRVPKGMGVYARICGYTYVPYECMQATHNDVIACVFCHAFAYPDV
jgi:hypothetical protein